MPVTGVIIEARRAAADVGPLVSFRMAGLRGRSRRYACIGGLVVLAITVASAVVPAFVEGASTSSYADNVKLLLPTAYLAFLITTAFAVIGAGGGRELLPRDQGVYLPVSPTTDHLGALLMAPLNVAWLVQSWTLLGLTAYGLGIAGLWAAQVTTLTWLFSATALAQLVAWVVEWGRRRQPGVLILRVVTVLAAAALTTLVATDKVGDVLDRSPTVGAVLIALDGRGEARLSWAVGTAMIAVAGMVCVATGAVVAHAVARRQPREELTAESQPVTPREMARSDLAALVRTDRASVWRSVPLRRGFVILALMPGVVAAAGKLEWEMLPVLPGLVAAGGALLFGVNAWSLDGVGALWRDSLPVRPQLVFLARVQVLSEMLLVATTLTLLVAGLRAGGLPTSAEAASLVATTVVVSLQVVARSMHWAVHRPFATDLKSARATPAPPVVMVGYSAYLALTSTLTGLIFSATAQADGPGWAISLATPFVILAVRRLAITSREWATPDVRAEVVATVAAR